MDITIVGGGTAAWLTASYLLTKLPGIRLTMIDKEYGNPIGVGEGTVLDFKPFLDECGFVIEDWFPACDASLKAGILFTNWQEKGNEFWHPFFINLRYKDLQCNIWDLYAFRQDLPYKDYACMLYDSAVRHHKVDVDDLASYAYHVDCGKLVQFLQTRLGNSIRIVKQEVVEVDKNENNSINSLTLKDGTTESADLFIDCTGFASVLKEQKRVDVSDRLFCDTAVAGRIPYENKEEELKPYIVCDAVDHGWIWRIPIESRLGSGLVFNRSVTSIDEAKTYLSNYWNGRIKEEDMKVIDWTPFYIENFWEKNVVSVGLSGGFIEPIESTGISIIIRGIRLLEERIRERFIDDQDAELYNAQMKYIYENCIDFVNMHYTRTNRTEPFWQFVKEKQKDTPYQLFMEQMMKDPKGREKMPIGNIPNTHNMFFYSSWYCLMIQYGFEFNPNIDGFFAPFVDQELERFYQIEQLRKLKSIPHIDFIKYVRQEK